MDQRVAVWGRARLPSPTSLYSAIQCHSYGWPGHTRCHTRLGAIGCASFVVGPTGSRLLAVRAARQEVAAGCSCSCVTLHCIAARPRVWQLNLNLACHTGRTKYCRPGPKAGGQLALLGGSCCSETLLHSTTQLHCNALSFRKLCVLRQIRNGNTIQSLILFVYFDICSRICSPVESLE